MKKLLSVVLAVAMLSTFVFSFSASAAEDHSFLPADASAFGKTNTANGTINVTKEGDSFVFEGTNEWPSAFYWDESCWLRFNENDDLYLYYDFEVVSGKTNVIVYFAGQNPQEQALLGSFICLNGLVDPSYVHPDTGDAVADLPVGKYSGKVAISDMGYDPFLKDADGNMLVSGFKVFAVEPGSKVVLNELSIGGPRGGAEEDTDTDATTTTKAPVKDDGKEPPKTGDASQALVFVVVAAVAGTAVTAAVVSKKKVR